MDDSVIRSGDRPVDDTDWGSLQWLVGKDSHPELGLTVGCVVFKPGKSNPAHHHPNCDELLTVIQGELEHSLPDGGTAKLGVGDSIILKAGRAHYARNPGSENAVVIVAFNSADRQTVGE